jgi:hypothetical protein
VSVIQVAVMGGRFAHEDTSPGYQAAVLPKEVNR